ncbi:hypothetical protein PBI_OAKER_40 [Mycobacterium phage Oaker]|uniref:hypothetical protein n=1 Tax=Mycobacterium phage Oaker TaxID=1445727 RepID=UPI0003E3EDF9|nr:hypothetical protein CH12_gp40 [Mycobacterium phage Oaker]AHG24431.1 hypothetical protein PBI_OAKER_40 [Mycobacterium phage Oaker]AVO26018.1 hypothetical protein SEA_THUMB_41 [Mycobacterium phage Thumb]AXH47166.1 hypothetical protein SEA_CBORCH11_42 [Mycobacterium phage Cborch11]
MNGRITYKQERYIRHLVEVKAWKFDAPQFVEAVQKHVDTEFANLTGGREGTGSKLIAYLLKLPNSADLIKDQHWTKTVDPQSPSKSIRTPKVADGWVKGRPTVGARPKAPTARPGLYVSNGEVFKVTESKRNPGQYVAKLIGTMDRGHRKAVYVKGMVFKLTEDQRMTPAQAKAYGDKFGQCVNCGKALNDPASVKLGMGPVCHKRLTAI